MRHPQIKKEKEEEGNRKSRKKSRKNVFVELTVSYCAGFKSEILKKKLKKECNPLSQYVYSSLAILIFTVILESPVAFNNVLNLSEKT